MAAGGPAGQAIAGRVEVGVCRLAVRRHSQIDDCRLVAGAPGAVLLVRVGHYRLPGGGDDRFAFDLVAAKERELTAEREYAEAWRDYWIARAELEKAVGGSLNPETRAAATSRSAEHDSKQPTKNVQNDEKHSSKPR